VLFRSGEEFIMTSGIHPSVAILLRFTVRSFK